ncbi:MAG: cytochrome C, partial [Rivularia sp. ALOHA_DT_140]|nr:cytochrome C [Rivularia sp. ALOHA_DT_140]
MPSIKRRNLPKLKKKPTVILLVALIWSFTMGWLFTPYTNTCARVPESEFGTVDVVPNEHKLGRKLY